MVEESHHTECEARMATPRPNRAGRVTGEFLLVVLGVLVALAVDSWWEVRQEREDERVYLQRLIEDLVEDSAVLALVDSATSEDVAELRAFSHLLARGVSDSDSLAFDRGISARFQLSRGAFQSAVTWNELVESGQLSLIRDTRLRGSLSTFFETVLPVISSAESRMESVMLEDAHLRTAVAGESWPTVSTSQYVDRAIWDHVDHDQFERQIREETLAAAQWSETVKSFQPIVWAQLEALRRALEVTQ